MFVFRDGNRRFLVMLQFLWPVLQNFQPIVPMLCALYKPWLNKCDMETSWKFPGSGLVKRRNERYLHFHTVDCGERLDVI